MMQNTGQLMKKRPREDHNIIGNGALFYALENAILTVYVWLDYSYSSFWHIHLRNGSEERNPGYFYCIFA